MDSMVFQSLQLMLYGLAGVFASLAVLYASVKIISKIFPNRDNNENKE